VVIEDHVSPGGFGSLVRDALAGVEPLRLLCRGWPRAVLPWGTEAAIRRTYRMDVESLHEDIRAFTRNRPAP
jgi:transketolase C-terminal domain/subunit